MPNKQVTATGYVVVGLVVLAISGAIIGYSFMAGTEPANGRSTTIAFMGPPIGVILVIIGIVKGLRRRRT